MCLYYVFEEQVKRRAADYEAIWSREGCYTYPQAYDRVNQYAQWYLSQGVKPGDLVGIYLMNSPDFIFAWIGLWAIGAAPAMINYNLAGGPLVHCLKISDVKLLLVGAEPDLSARVEESREVLERELNMKIVVMGEEARSEIYSQKAERPNDSYRREVVMGSPMAMLYTSGTTGLPKGCPFSVDRGIQVSPGVFSQRIAEQYQLTIYSAALCWNILTTKIDGTTVCLCTMAPVELLP